MRRPASGPTDRWWLAAWPVIAGLAVANGGFRERVLLPRLGEQRAHQVSTGMLLAAIWSGAAVLGRARPLPDRRAARRVGAIWAGSTGVFETGLGLARRLPVSDVLADYDLRAGRLWVLVPVSMAVAPVAVHRPG